MSAGGRRTYEAPFRYESHVASELLGSSKYSTTFKALGELVAKVKVVETIKEGETGLAANVVIVGALAGSRMLPIEIKNFEGSIREIFSPKDVELNLKAFRKGVKLSGSKIGIPATSKSSRRK